MRRSQVLGPASGFPTATNHDIRSICKVWIFYISILPGFGEELRLVFPTLQENSSPLSVMTQFLETLGRKIDQADGEKAGMIKGCNVMDLAHHILN